MRFDLPEQEKLTHEMVMPMRWGDMDAMGHVNNTVYKLCPGEINALARQAARAS